MRTRVLRKSVGPYSAGTKIWEENDGDLVVRDSCTDYIVVPKSDTVLLRNRIDVVPAVPREKRPDRIAKRFLYNLKVPVVLHDS